MRILVLGAYGLIGLSIAKALEKEGHSVVGLGRNESTARRLLPTTDWLTADIATLVRPEQWTEFLEGIQIVVNASGALQSSSKDNLVAVQGDAIVALISACERVDVLRFVQVSAVGASSNATTQFLRTKAIADNALRRSTIDWVILRPGLVLAPTAYGGTALLRVLAGIPLIQPIMLGDSRLQTVAVGELADIVREACESQIPAGSDLDVVENESHTLIEIIDAFRMWLGAPTPKIRFSVPRWMGRCIARLADALGFLGWRSPLRSTTLDVLEDSVLGRPSHLQALRGRSLKSLERTLADMPSTLQERWFARLYLAMPLVIGTLAAFWMASGVIASLRFDEALAVLPSNVADSVLGPVFVGCGILVDLVLGATVLYRPWAIAACWGMIVATMTYLMASTILVPALWMDPLGALVKTIPAMVLAWLAILLLEER